MTYATTITLDRRSAPLFPAFASAGTLYLPAYPNAVLVFDEAKAQIVDRIPLETGTPMSIRLSPDHKKIYVTTIDHNGIEVIDVATRKVINHFVLNTPDKAVSAFQRHAGSGRQAVLRGDQRKSPSFRTLRGGQAEIHGDRSGAAEDRQDRGYHQGRRSLRTKATTGWARLRFRPTASICTSSARRSRFCRLAISKWSITSIWRSRTPGMENVHFGGDLDLINSARRAHGDVHFGPIPWFTIACLGWRASI